MAKSITRLLVKNTERVTYGRGNPCNYITIHETANYEDTADALNHAKWQYSGDAPYSWHYTVDDHSIFQSYLDEYKCWHAGDKRGRGNMESVGIEICVNEGLNFKQAVDNAAWLTAKLMRRHNIPIENVVPHKFWSGKDCPHNILNKTKGVSWDNFIDNVNKYLKQTVKLYKVQVGAFKDYKNAIALRDKIKKLGFDAFIFEEP